MSEHCFSFLDKDFPKISDNCFKCEKHLVEGNLEDSINHAGIACELITKQIARGIAKEELNKLKQVYRLEKLINYYQVIPEDIGRKFDKIRLCRNKVEHSEPIDLNISYNLHKKLYEICIWFYNMFLLNNPIDSNYNGPIYVSDKINADDFTEELDKHKEETNKKIEELNRKIDEFEKQRGESFNKDNLAGYEFNAKKGSFLLNELSKLNISSAEAVESEDNLNFFKNYLHVNRLIQDDFINELKRVVDEESSHLVMLCGSVGDGKSHLLAYLKTHCPELYDKFTIHGDATESHFTQKNAEATLAEVLTSFDDDNIDSSSEKFVLAINLGILNNFLESDYCSSRYTKLKKIIEDADIFNSDKLSENIIQDKVSFITFSDYNLFELTGDSDTDYVSSEYISSLIHKITDEDCFNNPFYRAYMRDKESNLNSPIIYNYEILCDEDVQKVLIDYIIRIFVEYKKIISTRDLLNLIYELLVPPELNQYDSNDGITDFIDYLLPNMLFNNKNRSDLLNLLSRFDPTLIRNEKLDEFIIKLNVSYNLVDVLKEYFSQSKVDLLNAYFAEEIGSFNKEKLTVTLIRFAIFYGKDDFKRNFVDENYLMYLRYLYAYNTSRKTNDYSGYRNLFEEVKDAIFNFKGSIKKGYISIDELESFIVSKDLKIDYNHDSFGVDYENELGNRFKTSINVIFSTKNNEEFYLEVDYPLYSAISKINNGYAPNTVERENLILFDEFINKLIEKSPSDDLFVKNFDFDIEFTFSYKRGFQNFIFEKGG